MHHPEISSPFSGLDPALWASASRVTVANRNAFIHAELDFHSIVLLEMGLSRGLIRTEDLTDVFLKRFKANESRSAESSMPSSSGFSLRRMKRQLFLILDRLSLLGQVEQEGQSTVQTEEEEQIETETETEWEKVLLHYRTRRQRFKYHLHSDDPGATIPYLSVTLGWISSRSRPKLRIEDCQFDRTCHFVRLYGSENLLSVLFLDREKKWGKKRLEDEENLIRVLREGGILLGGKKWKYLTFSMTSMRSRTLYFVVEDIRDDVRSRWFGNNDEDSVGGRVPIIWKKGGVRIDDPVKVAKRRGVLFTKGIPTIKISRKNMLVVPDIVRVGNGDDGTSVENFTEGAGLIGDNLLLRIARFLGNQQQEIVSLPAAIQIRCMGFKGMLVRDRRPEMGDSIHFRQSQLKFDIPDDFLSPLENDVLSTVLILGVSRPVSQSKTNIELLLCGQILKVSSREFVRKHRKQLDHIVRVASLGKSNLRFLRSHLQRIIESSPDAAVALGKLSAGFPLTEISLQKNLKRLSRTAVESLFDSEKIRKSAFTNIPLRAVCLYGVPDPTGLLPPSCIFVHTCSGSGQSEVLNYPVVVGKNPMIHPKDLQLMKAIPCPELEYLTNVVVFSVQGKTSPCRLIGENDYDGDQYLVIYEGDIVQIFTDRMKSEIMSDLVSTETSSVVFERDLPDDFSLFTSYDPSLHGRIHSVWQQYACVDRPDPIVLEGFRAALLALVRMDVLTENGLPKNLPWISQRPSAPRWMQKRGQGALRFEKPLILDQLYDMTVHCAQKCLDLVERSVEGTSLFPLRPDISLVDGLDHVLPLVKKFQEEWKRSLSFRGEIRDALQRKIARKYRKVLKARSLWIERHVARFCYSLGIRQDGLVAGIKPDTWFCFLDRVFGERFFRLAETEGL